MPSNRATPESLVKKKVDAILKRHGCWYFKPVSNGMGKHGIPDYIVAVPPMGRLLGIECKGADGLLPTALQTLQLQDIRAHGGLTYLATPSTVGGLDVLLTTLKDPLLAHAYEVNREAEVRRNVQQETS